MAFSGSPDNCLSNSSDNFPKFSFVWTQELKISKMVIFRRCLEIAGKAENGGKILGAKPIFFIINLRSILSLFPAGALLQNIYTLGVTVYNI